MQRQAKFTFPAWLYRTVPMSYKYTNKRERSKTKLALILFSRAKVSSSFNSNIVKGECNGKRNLHFRLDSAEPYPIFYKDSEKRAEEKWPRFFILNHIVKRDGCFFNSRLVYNNRKENAFIRSPVYLTREYRLISCRIPKSCREGSETTYIELRILMFEE